MMMMMTSLYDCVVTYHFLDKILRDAAARCIFRLWSCWLRSACQVPCISYRQLLDFGSFSSQLHLVFSCQVRTLYCLPGSRA